MAAASTVRMTGASRRAHLGRGRRGGGRTRLTRTSRGTPPPSPRPSPAPGRAREFIGHKATPTILDGPLRRRGLALPSLPAPGSRGSVRACGVETKRAIAHPSMRSRKWLPGRGPPRWSRPPHGKRGVEQHLEGWSHADGPIGTKPAETGGGHRGHRCAEDPNHHEEGRGRRESEAIDDREKYLAV